MKYKIVVACGWMILLWSCTETKKSSKTYFNVDSLVDSQVAYLTKAQASIIKKASLDTAKDESKFKPDSTLWAHELEVFRHLDIINKSIYVDAYDVIDGQNDPNSNLTIREYRAKREAPIREFKLYYQNTFDKLKRIEATVTEANTLYFTKRKLLMELDTYSGKTVLNRYSIHGTQKMILSDSVQFSISSKVIY